MIVLALNFLHFLKIVQVFEFLINFPFLSVFFITPDTRNPFVAHPVALY